MPSPFQSLSPDQWKSDFFLRTLEAVLPRMQMLSLDIFDTILLRTVSDPSDVFVKAAEAAQRRGIWTSALTPDEYRLMRIQAERSAREKQLLASGHDEITLEQIYQEIPASIGSRELLLQLELEHEQEVCYLNPNLGSLIQWSKAGGIQVALLSDMYLSSKQLQDLLQSSGLAHTSIDVLMVSSEEKCSKASGGLFARLLSTYPTIPANAIIHIGDQLRSDIHGAAIHNIQALHYRIIPDTFERSYHWDNIRHGSVLPGVRSLSKLTEHTLDPDITNETERFYYQFGVYAIGPFLTSFCEWVIDVCAAEQRCEVHPLMREGVLLAPLLEQIASQRGVSIAVKPLYVSRQATYLASLDQFGKRELRRLLETDCTIAELFRVLDIQQESGPLKEWLDLTVSQCKITTDESGSNVLDRVERFFLEAHIRSAVQRSMERHRRLLTDYLQQTCTNAGQLMTVDIGFHGTIQKNIEFAWNASVGAKDQMIHLLAVGGAGLEKLHLQGMDVRCHLGGVGRNADLGQAIVRSPAFLEELLMGDFGTAIGYERDSDGTVKPVLAPLNQEDNELRAKQACHRGVLAFQESFHALRGIKPNLTDILDPCEWYKPIHRVITMPTPEEAQHLGDLNHQDHYLGEVSSICQPIAETWFAKGEEAFLRACNFGPSTLNAYWPQGTLTRNRPYYLYEHYMKTNDSFGIGSLVFELVQQIQKHNFTTISLLGSGRVAERMMERAYLHQIFVKHYIRSVEQLAAETSVLRQDTSSCYVIASLVEEEIAAWREGLGELYRGSDGMEPVVIFPLI